MYIYREREKKTCEWHTHVFDNKLKPISHSKPGCMCWACTPDLRMDHLSGPELAVLTCFTGGPYESVQLRVYLHMYIYTGWWFQPLWRILYNHLGLLFPIDGKIKNVPNNQPVYIYMFVMMWYSNSIQFQSITWIWCKLVFQVHGMNSARLI